MGLIKVGLVQPEFTPVEIATSGLHRIYPYGQLSAVEAGSSDAPAEGGLTQDVEGLIAVISNPRIWIRLYLTRLTWMG